MLISPRRFVRLCRARSRLVDCDEATSIGELAAEPGLSPFQFIRQYSALFGETPHQQRIKARIERAKHTLALDRESVTEVCMGPGFSALRDKDRGVAFTKPPRKAGAVTIAVFSNTCGNLIQLYQPPSKEYSGGAESERSHVRPRR